MNLNIALVELSTHNEVVWAFSKVLLKSGANLKIFCSEFVKTQLYDLHGEENIMWYINVGSNNQEFLKIQLGEMNQSDLLIFTTVLPGNFSFFINTGFGPKTAFVMHDAHFFFDPFRHLYIRREWPSAVKDILKIIKFMLFREHKRNRTFLNSFDALLVPSAEVFQYIHKFKSSIFQKITAVLDFAVLDNSNIQRRDKSKNQVIRIAIPGSINNKSRDYLPVLHAFQNLALESELKIQLKLLGSPIEKVGRSIVRSFEALHSETIDVMTFSNFVDQKVFDNEMKNSDFLILPVNQNMGISPVRERNGYSCVSGNINDMVKYGKPSLIPASYPVPETLISVVQQYSNANELFSLILQWIEKSRTDELPGKDVFQSHSTVILAKKWQPFLTEITQINKTHQKSSTTGYTTKASK